VYWVLVKTLLLPATFVEDLELFFFFFHSHTALIVIIRDFYLPTDAQ
jgi:hypothetical protein